MATSSGALAQDSEPSTSSLTVTDSIPAGFESLMEDQSLFVEVTFNGDRVGTFNVSANAEFLTFDDPSLLLESLASVKKQPQLREALAAPLPTNAHLICYARNEPAGCGQVDPSPVAIIFDDSLLTLELFIAADLQLVQNQAIERYLPAAQIRGSSILAFDLLASDSLNQSSLDLTTRASTSYGPGQVFAEAEYNSRTEAVRVRSLQLTHLFRDQELTLGAFNYGATSVLNNKEILGASFKSSLSTRVDLDDAFSSQLVIYLPRRSLVQVIVDERVYLAERYDAGNQTLDTTSLPTGTNDVELRINDPVSGVRSEFRSFTKSTQIPPRNETLFDVTLGTPLTFGDSIVPEREDVLIGGIDLSRRITDQSSWRLGLVGVGRIAMAELQYLLLKQRLSVQLGVGAGNFGINSSAARFSYRVRRSSASFDVRWFHALPSLYRDEVLEDFLPNNSTQIGISLNHSFGKTSISTRFNERKNTDVDGLTSTSSEKNVSVRHRLKQRGALRASLQASYSDSNVNGYRVSFGITGTFYHPSSSTTRLVLGNTQEELFDSGTDLTVSHQIRSAIEAPTQWDLQLRAEMDEVGESFDVTTGIENDIVSASLNGEWNLPETGTLQRSGTARLSTRIAVDRNGLAIGGSSSARSGIIMDVTGEPAGAKYDIVINGVKRGTGKVNKERFIGLEPLREYSVELLPQASLASAMDNTSFEFTLYPGSVQRLQSSAQRRVLLIATIVDELGNIVSDGFISGDDDNPLRISPEGTLQLEATPGARLTIKRDTGPECSVLVPDATETNLISVPPEPLVCEE